MTETIRETTVQHAQQTSQQEVYYSLYVSSMVAMHRSINDPS